jgi:SAM-dependent methyltransferase
MKPPATPPPEPEWWRAFFESPDSLRLAFFPGEPVTRQQVEALDGLMRPWRPRRVLDLCCGPGRHLAPLARRGYPMVGLDACRLMAERARAAAREHGGEAGVVRGEAQRLPFGDGAFGVVLCLFNSFGYLKTDDEDQQVLGEVARCLESGGRFVLDTRNRSYQLSQLPFSEIVPLPDGGAVWLECRHDAARGRLVSEFRTAGTGKLLYRASIRSYSLGELETMLNRAGLRVEARFSGYGWEEFEGKSRELLILARKG